MTRQGRHKAGPGATLEHRRADAGRDRMRYLSTLTWHPDDRSARLGLSTGNRVIRQRCQRAQIRRSDRLPDIFISESRIAGFWICPILGISVRLLLA